MCNDYRVTKYCNKFENIICKKNELEEIIKKEHKRAENLHKLIHPNAGEYKIPFMNIYNYKCSYCGVSIDIIPITHFEIDHIVAKSTFSSEAKAGHIENLALACHDCNHAKLDIFVDNELLNPDKKLGEVFYRDNLFNVLISEEYAENKAVNEFYKKLNLGGTLRRLDFILMNLKGLQKKYKEKYNAELDNINDTISIITRARNLSVLSK